MLGDLCLGSSSRLWCSKERVFFSFVSIRSCRVIFCWKRLHQVFLSNIFSGKFVLKYSCILNEGCLYLGQYTVISITQGGCGIPYLDPAVYEYICTGKLPSDIEVPVKSLPNTTLQFVLQKVNSPVLNFTNLQWPTERVGGCNTK